MIEASPPQGSVFTAVALRKHTFLGFFKALIRAMMPDATAVYHFWLYCFQIDWAILTIFQQRGIEIVKKRPRCRGRFLLFGRKITGAGFISPSA